MIFPYARQRRRRIIEVFMLGGVNEVEGKISQKDAKMEMANSFLTIISFGKWRFAPPYTKMGFAHNPTLRAK